MKLIALMFTTLFCTSLIAGVPKGCPSTRACSDDANCKIYAFKHNCHGVCTQRQMKDMAQNIISCPAQCLCEKLTPVTA
jgi:hypothetical protein